MTFAKTISESVSVSAELDRLAAAYPRFQDWWECGWSWRLARNPLEDATPIPGTDPQVYLLRTSSQHVNYGFPFTLTFLFTVTENEINLLEIRFVAISV